MLAKTIDIKDAQNEFQELVSSVATGAEITLTQDGTPVARLVPVKRASAKRIPGLHPGAAWISPDFDQALPDTFWSGTS